MPTRVWTEMEARGWGLREFARRLSGDDYRVTHSTLIEYRDGKSRMPREFMERCRAVLGLSLDELFPADEPTETTA